MPNPYEPPPLSETKTRQLFFWGVVLLVIAVAMPILGLVGTAAGMMHSVGPLNDSDATAESVATSISFSLTATLLGAVIGVVCGILGGVMVFISRRRG